MSDVFEIYLKLQSILSIAYKHQCLQLLHRAQSVQICAQRSPEMGSQGIYDILVASSWALPAYSLACLPIY